jgi:hypothetical protein
LAALRVAEQFADDLADVDEIVSAFEVTHEVGSEGGGTPARAAALISLALGVGNNFAYEAYQDLVDLTQKNKRAARRAWGEQVVRCIWGLLPFRRVTADPSWRTPTVLALARGVYVERAFDRMPILADALEDAGCENPDVLAHCRNPGSHARGCWVIDLLLGRG